MQDIALLVTGSRSINSQAIVFERLDAFATTRTIRSLTHGGAAGVDTLAGEWAAIRGVPVTVVRPDFKTWPVGVYRWKAYLVRDYAMVDAVDEVIAIWDGKSNGTRKTFEYAEKTGKLVTISVYSSSSSFAPRR